MVADQNLHIDISNSGFYKFTKANSIKFLIGDPLVLIMNQNILLIFLRDNKSFKR